MLIAIQICGRFIKLFINLIQLLIKQSKEMITYIYVGTVNTQDIC